MADLDDYYRPKTFDEIIGNKRMLKVLETQIKKERRPHTYLFYGPSGTGKTTIGRIMKDMLECSDEDFKEINAADTRGIDTARKMIEQCHYKPLNGPTRIFLIDECHMGTSAFLNALLKPLEKPPDHVYFILCTTEPEKLLSTIKTRCTKFKTRKLIDEEINELLSWVLKNEKVNIPSEAIEQIITIAEGCPREALVLLDQIIDLETDEEMIEAAKALVTDKQQIIDLCRAILKKDKWQNIMKIYKGIKDEPERIRRAILGYLQSVLISKGDDRIAAMIALFEDQGIWHSGKPALTRMIYDATQ